MLFEHDKLDSAPYLETIADGYFAVIGFLDAAVLVYRERNPGSAGTTADMDTRALRWPLPQ